MATAVFLQFYKGKDGKLITNVFIDFIVKKHCKCARRNQKDVFKLKPENNP